MPVALPCWMAVVSPPSGPTISYWNPPPCTANYGSSSVSRGRWKRLMSSLPMDDEVLGKAYDPRLMRRLLQYARPYWQSVVMATILVFGTSVMDLAGPTITRVAVDRYIQPRDWAGLGWVSLAYLG